MASTVVDIVAEALAGVATDLSIGAGEVVAYKWEVGYAGISKTPAVMIGLPELERVGIDEPEPELGSDGWWMDFPVNLIVDLGNATTASTWAAEFVEAFIKAIDTQVLQENDASILDAKVTTAQPVLIVDQARPQLAYECRVLVAKYV